MALFSFRERIVHCILLFCISFSFSFSSFHFFSRPFVFSFTVYSLHVPFTRLLLSVFYLSSVFFFFL